MNNLGQLIKEKREAKKLSQSDLSKLTKLSLSVIDDLENDRFDDYKGDEIYVKGYIKKIGEVLDLDVEGMTQTYLSLTTEIKQKEFEEALAKEAEEKEKIANRNKINISDIKINKPDFTKTQAVYSDNATNKYIQSGIILVVILAIVGVCFYGVIKTKDKVETPSFNANTNTNVQGNVDQDDENTNQDTNTSTNGEVTLVRNGFLDFSLTLPENTTEVDFKAEFGSNTWSQFFIDESLYKEIEGRVYAKGESIEVKFDASNVKTFRLHNGFNLGHKYYINGVEVPLDSSADSSTTVADLVVRITNNNDSTNVTVTNSTNTTKKKVQQEQTTESTTSQQDTSDSNEASVDTSVEQTGENQ